MDIVKELNNGALILNLKGRLDMSSASKLQEALLPAFDEAKEITLNFAEISYVSSAGLRVLLMGQKQAKPKNAQMQLCNVSPDVMEVLEMTGFSSILTIVG